MVRWALVKGLDSELKELYLFRRRQTAASRNDLTSLRAEYWMEQNGDEVKSTHSTATREAASPHLILHLRQLSRPPPPPQDWRPEGRRPYPGLRAGLGAVPSGCLHLRRCLLRQHLHEAASEAHSCQIPPYLPCKHRYFTLLSEECSSSSPWGKQKFQPPAS